MKWISVITLAFCCVCFTAVGAEQEAATWKVSINPARTLGPVNHDFAGANVNKPERMLLGLPGFDEAVAGLNIRMMRFQVPNGTLDYKESASWTDETFARLDEAVDKARNTWGVQRLLFGINRISMPVVDGRLIEEDFPAYADACARMVQRFAPPGNVRVEYWEPFNEEESPKHMKALAAHGQGFGTVLALYRVCAERMKSVNPDIKVGGPALCFPSSSAVRDFVETCGDSVDFVSWHDYSTGNAATTDETVLLTVTEGKRFLPATRRIEKLLGELGRPELPMFLDEFHVNYSAWKPVDVRTATQFSAVFTGSVLANLQSTRLRSAMIHDVISRGYGLLGPASNDRLSTQLGTVSDSPNADAIHVRPAGWVYRWFNQLVRGAWVECRTDVPSEDASGARGRLLDACAWGGANQWGALLVNKDTVAHSLALHTSKAVTAEGFALPMKVYTVAGGRAYEANTSGTRDGIWQTELPAMSVTFVCAPES